MVVLAEILDLASVPREEGISNTVSSGTSLSGNKVEVETSAGNEHPGGGATSSTLLQSSPLRVILAAGNR